MNLLLDTHIFLWALFEPKKIPARIKASIDQEQAIYISTITFWEISLKFARGKIDLKGTFPDALPEIARNDGFQILDLNIDTAASFYKLPIINKDPFDRMLAWQAINSDCILLTQDPSLSSYVDYGLKIVR